MSWKDNWTTGQQWEPERDAELDMLVRALRPIAGRVYASKERVFVPGIISQMKAAQDAEQAALVVETAARQAPLTIGQRVLNWLRSWVR